MSIPRKIMATLVAAALASVALVGLSAGPAAAWTNGCRNVHVAYVDQHWDTWNWYTGEGAWSSPTFTVPYNSCRDTNVSAINSYDQYNSRGIPCATWWTYDATTGRNYPADWHNGPLICGNQPGSGVISRDVPDGHRVRIGIHPWAVGGVCEIPAGCRSDYWAAW